MDTDIANMDRNLLAALLANGARLTSDVWWDEYQTAVHCPQCGFDHTHPTAVVINAGGHWLCYTGKEEFRHGDGPVFGRGVYIAVHFYCENGGHFFRHEYQFHKGVTGHQVSIDRTMDAEGDCSTIWRD